TCTSFQSFGCFNQNDFHTRVSFFAFIVKRFRVFRAPLQVAFHNGVPLYIELPVTVELEVTHTEPGLQGDRSSAGTKPATLQTGAQINVPLFINTGDKLKVDSRDGSYLGRVNA
ncbi:hypothetical protein ABLN64_14620, partial [Mycobacterium tuberculosis]